MGFFSKIWKGIKKGFKKVFKPIKKVFTSFGKFMNKIGIVGQLAMAFILPLGIGTALSGMFSNLVGSLAGGTLGGIGKAAGWVLGKAHEFAKLVGAGYKTVTGAVTDFLGTAGKYVGGKLGIGTLPNQTLGQAFGKEGWGGRLSDSFSKLGDAATEFWDMDIKGSLPKEQVADKVKLGEFEFDERDGIPDVRKIPPPTTDGWRIQKAANIESIPNFSELGFSTTAKKGYMGFQVGEQKFYLDPAADLEQLTKYVDMEGLAEQSIGIVGEAATTTQEQGFISKSLETLTGEKTWGGAGRKLVETTGESLLASPGQAFTSTLTTGFGQAVGVLPKPQEQKDPGPPWGGYAPQHVSQQYVSMPQQTQQMPSAFSEFAMGQSFNTDPNGSWLGNSFWSDYMRQAQSFA